MIARIIRKKTCFIDDPAIDSFHYLMFHGRVTNRGELLPLGQRPRMQLEINVYKKNDIFMPMTKLVVSDRVKSILEKMFQLSFRDIIIKKAVYIPYNDYSFTHWDDPNYYDDGEGPQRVMRSHPDIQNVLEDMPHYYEVDYGSLSEIERRFSNLKRFEVEMETTRVTHKFIGRLSGEILTEYPLLWHDGCTVLSEAAFDAIGAYFNFNYFLIRDIDV
jgi:hypothetical protein